MRRYHSCAACRISAKIDCADEHKTTPLSEAAGAGQTAVCELLVAHGADVNSQNAQARTPLWRAAFMDRRETAAFLLTVGGDPRLRSEAADTPAMVAPSPELTATLEGWDVEETDRLLAARAKALEGQWVPPPPDPEDTPAGQAGYFLQLPLLRFAGARVSGPATPSPQGPSVRARAGMLGCVRCPSVATRKWVHALCSVLCPVLCPVLPDALDSVTAESDRPVLVCDLSGKVLTYFEYTDSNLHCWARPKDVESESLRRGLLGALRYGKARPTPPAPPALGHHAGSARARRCARPLTHTRRVRGGCAAGARRVRAALCDRHDEHGAR